jgi:hypothetical protein
MSSNRICLYALLIGCVVTAIPSCRKSDFTIDHEEMISDRGGGTGTVTWTSDREYLLDGFVFVNDGQTLTIEAGTVIRARTGQGSLASALIVARGGTIIAEGEPDNPIIFTVEGDDLEGSVPVAARGLWGGLILLGHATINTETGEDLIEGIPISEPRGVYGGHDDDDNSGILRYVSIRHGGTNIGEGNEINGLTLGGVGRQTIIEYVEVISNADDGVEFFGGTVNCSNLIVAFCGDDAFDIDQGYHGKGQFWLAVDSPDSDQCFEITGGIDPVTALPGSFPLIFNATLAGNMGSGIKPVAHFLSYGGGHIMNSIFLNAGEGISVHYTEAPGDSYSLFRTGDLSVNNCILFPAAEPLPRFFCYSEFVPDLSAVNEELADSLVSWKNSYEDPGLSASDTYRLLPPTTVFEDLALYRYPWFEPVTYKGAFGSRNWLEGWTLFHQAGYVEE